MLMSCRLVAEAAQAGSVIGKGGRVVQMTKKNTGCKIRVLTDDLPLCASSSDEIIEVPRLVRMHSNEMDGGLLNAPGKSLVLFLLIKHKLLRFLSYLLSDRFDTIYKIRKKEVHL